MRTTTMASSGRALSACFGALMVAASASAQAPPTFVYSPQIPTGLAPYAVEVVDMDGDGDRDIVTSDVADQEVSTISVVINNGDGTFNLPVSYEVGPSADDLSVADFNGDNRPDVVCVIYLSGNDAWDLTSYVTVLLNNGSGGLGNAQNYYVGENAHPASVEIGDFTGDGKIDFAVACHVSARVWVYRNTGAGSFALWTSWSFSSARHLGAADFNQDGRLDLVVGNMSATQVFFNTGTGFSGQAYVDNGFDGVQGIATGDFDQDGKPDFALSGYHVSIYRNNGNGTVFTKTVFRGSVSQVGIKAGDMDGDGFTDLSVSNYGANSVSVYSNDGSGGFDDRCDWGVGWAPNSHGIGDINGDGRPDIVVANSQLNQSLVNLIINAGNRKYVARTEHILTGAANGVASADFNRDGFMDLVSGAYVSNNDGPNVFYGTADGSLGEGFQIENWGNNIPTDVAVGDFNRDGWPDFVTSIFSPGNRIRVNMNRGDGTFFTSVSYDAGGNPAGVAVGDLNGDGWQDIVCTNGSSNDNSISVFVNVGNGTFLPQVRYPVGFRPGSVIIADFDMDGLGEVVVTHYGSNSIIQFESSASGALGGLQTYNLGTTQGNAVAGDFDNDGWLDIAIGAGSVLFMRNNHSGSFQLPIVSPVQAGYIGAADWNLDGLLDIVGSNGVSNMALVGMNSGGGHFALVGTLPTGTGPGRLIGVDMDRDGKPEIVTANYQAQSLSVFQNITSTESTVQPNSLSVLPGQVTSGDMTSLFASDENKLVGRPGMVLFASQAPLQVTVEGTAPAGTVSSLSLVIESSADMVAVRETVEVFNFQTGQYETLYTGMLTTTDVRRTLSIPNPNAYIGPGNKLRAKLSYRTVGLIFRFPWYARLDEVTWRVTP